MPSVEWTHKRKLLGYSVLCAQAGICGQVLRSGQRGCFVLCLNLFPRVVLPGSPLGRFQKKGVYFKCITNNEKELKAPFFPHCALCSAVGEERTDLAPSRRQKAQALLLNPR